MNGDRFRSVGLHLLKNKLLFTRLDGESSADNRLHVCLFVLNFPGFKIQILLSYLQSA